jgi:hypothetical protein
MAGIRRITLMVTRSPAINSDGRCWPEQVQDFVDYYQYLIETKGSSWVGGLFMAQQWASLLSEATTHLNEANQLLGLLEAEAASQGTDWSDVCIRMARWVEGIEGKRRV